MIRLFGIYRERQARPVLYRENYGWITVYLKICLFFDGNGNVKFRSVTSDLFKVLDFNTQPVSSCNFIGSSSRFPLHFHSPYGSKYDVSLDVEVLAQKTLRCLYTFEGKSQEIFLDLFDVDYEDLVKQNRSLTQDSPLFDSKGLKTTDVVRANTVVRLLESEQKLTKVLVPLERMLKKAVKNEFGEYSSFIFEETEGWVPSEILRKLSEYEPPSWYMEQNP